MIYLLLACSLMINVHLIWWGRSKGGNIEAYKSDAARMAESFNRNTQKFTAANETIAVLRSENLILQDEITVLRSKMRAAYGLLTPDEDKQPCETAQ